jgi:hypothetical protein
MNVSILYCIYGCLQACLNFGILQVYVNNLRFKKFAVSVMGQTVTCGSFVHTMEPNSDICCLVSSNKVILLLFSILREGGREFTAMRFHKFLWGLKF